MNNAKIIIIGCLLWLMAGAAVVSGAQGVLGVGYGHELRGNDDIGQLELFYRMPLSYQKDLGPSWKLATALEFAGAVIDDADPETSVTGRMAFMPQVMLSPGGAFHFHFGLGLGVMMGETEFAEHNLGGPLFFSAKTGVVVLIGKHFGFEYNYYHQSNAGIYDYNASLNMHHVAISYRF